MCLYVCMCVCVCMYVCLNGCVHWSSVCIVCGYECVCMCVFVCMYVCVFVYVCEWDHALKLCVHYLWI